MPTKPKKEAKATKEEGTVYVSCFGAYTQQTGVIDAQKLLDYKDNVWCRGLAQKHKNLLFTDKFTIEVLDPKGTADEELEQRITNMCEKVRLWAKMQLGYKDGIFWYGAAIYNQVWGYEDSEYVLRDLRYLPAYTFRNAGTSQEQTYSELLQGITLDNKKQPEFWQTDDLGQSHQLKTENIFWIKDPSVSALAGESIILPLIPIVEMLKFAWQTQMQYMNRVGAPIIFIKFTDPPRAASECLDGVSDLEYAQGLLQNWGKDTAFVLRDNMVVVELDIKNISDNREVIELLTNMLLDYMSPSSFISQGEGALFGGSEKQQEELLYKYIQGIHTWLEDQFERLLQTYLDINGYEGYVVNMRIPSPSLDKSEIMLKQAETGFKTQSLSKNELRELLGQTALDEEGLSNLKEEYPMVPSPSLNAEVYATNTVEDPILLRELNEAAVKLSEDIIKAVGHEE